MPLIGLGQGVRFTSLFTKKPMFDEVGFSTGFGFGSNAQSLPEGTYRPIYFMGYFANHLLREEFRKTYRTLPFFYVEPQFNIANVEYPDGKLKQYYEFGINNGFKQNFKITEYLHLYILIGTGPHFISIDTEKQKKYFIFSNCMGFGMQLYLKNRISIMSSFRIKHMSNLQLFLPNSGINSYNFHFGFSYKL